MLVLYSISIFAYKGLIYLASFFNAKAKSAVKERKKSLDELYAVLKSNQSPITWFHTASLGEFEQGLPVMEAYKSKHPKRKILVTFFSPSGYQHRKDHPIADYTAYLPWDTKTNAEKFIAAVQPKEVFFVKYEFWFFMLDKIHKEGIPLYSISARFVKQQTFFRNYGSLHRQMLTYFNHIFVQNNSSRALLASIDVKNVSVSGDTRFDNVMVKASTIAPIDQINRFKGDDKLLVIGSAWKEDLEVLKPFLDSLPAKLKVLIAPHDIDEANIKRMAKLLPLPHCLFSDKASCQKRIMILDTIGHLFKAYQYADLAFIGGAFGDGLHNILEATAFGTPVIFGNKGLDKFPEANELIDKKGGFSVSNSQEASEILTRLFANQPFREQTKQICLAYMAQHQGATQKIIDYLESVK